MSDNSLLQDFITETGEHLEDTERNLLRLEQQPDDVELLNTIFRSVHTIKGSSEYLGLEGIAELSHKLEGLLDLLRRGERHADSAIIDLLMGCNDRIGLLVGEVDKTQEEQTSIEDLVSRLQKVTEGTDDASEDIDDDEFGEDEHDEELFGIFVEQLKEGLSGLIQDTRQLLSGHDGLQVLEESVERLTTLRSSANYMGYDELKGLYEKWAHGVDEAIALLRNGGNFDQGQFARETMVSNIEQVQSLFPKVDFDPVDWDEDDTLSFADADSEEMPEQAVQSADQGLLADFITETGEHLEETERNLLRLEQTPDDAELLVKIFRSVHTIKGSSEYLGLERIAELAHKLESLLDLMRHGDRGVDSNAIDLLMGCNDRFGVLIDEVDQHGQEQSSANDLLNKLKEITEQTGSEEAAEDDDLFEEDEYDEELFGIFIEQLTEGINGLSRDALALADEEVGVDVLQKSTDRLTILRSSSNYMGYEELKSLYEKWSQDVDDAISALDNDEEIDLEAFARETMVANIDKVTSMFPKVSFSTDEEPANDELPAVEATDHDTSTEEIDQGGDQGLLADFITETVEHLEETERNLLQLEKKPDDVSLLNEIFRSIHTIKGSSEYLGMERIAQLAHKLENLLDLLRRNERVVDNNVVDLLMECNDRINALISELGADQKVQTGIADLLEQLEAIAVVSEEAAVPTDTVEKVVIEDDTGAVYVEEYDKELFSIFMEQFNSGLQNLTEESEQLSDDASSPDVLKRCCECLQTLRSSANYMEYDKLLDFYDGWLAEIDAIVEKQKAGEAVDIEAFKDAVMTANTLKAKNFFTKFRPVTQSLEESPDSEVKEVEEEPAPSEVPDEEKAEPEVEIPTLSLNDIRDTDNFVKPEQLPSAEDDSMLLDKLANAFESRLGFSDIVVKQYFNENIENNLFSDEKTEVPKDDVAPIQEEKKDSDYDDIVDVENVESLLFSGSGKPKKETTLPEPIAIKPTVKASRASASATGQTSPLRRSRFKVGQRQTDKFRDRMIKQSIRVDASKIDVLMNQVGELVVSRSGFNQLLSEVKDLQLMLKQSQKLNSKEMQAIKAISNRINEASTSLGRVTSELQENVMKVRMLPIAQLFSRYPRLVHDLVRGTEKKVNLEIYGEDTELDKKVIEQLTDPLVHIIRNAVDHGIEETDVRKQNGKEEIGTIRMEAYPESNYVVIEISDDGHGVDVDKIRQRALEKGFVTEDEAAEMTNEEMLSMIMRPGFSTADEVTHTSGRGVGMDVVKDNIEKLNGAIEIDSTVGTGAKFQIKIPLTLAIIPALLVRVVNDTFTIPLSSVDETIRIHKDDISTIEGLEVYDLRGTTIPLIRMEEALNMRGGNAVRDEQFVVIVNTGDRQVGFVVDELKGRQEVVIKPLEDYLQEKSGFSGATILGDGSISLILDVYEMVQISLGRHTSRVKAATS